MNRQTGDYSNVGQNYAMTASSVNSSTTDWENFVQMWYDEVKNMFTLLGQCYTYDSAQVHNVTGKVLHLFKYQVEDFPPGNVESFSSAGATGVIGHYTQVVWAETHEVGCGYIYYLDGMWYTKVNQNRSFIAETEK